MKRYMLSLFAVLFAPLLFVMGCDTVRREVFPTTQEQTNRIYYVKDTRTNMCFVHNTVYTDINSRIYTHVPCTPEVEALIQH